MGERERSAVRARLGRKPTENVAAYQLFLKGRHCLLKYRADGVRQGIEFLTQATANDPTREHGDLTGDR